MSEFKEERVTADGSHSAIPKKEDKVFVSTGIQSAPIQGYYGVSSYRRVSSFAYGTANRNGFTVSSRKQGASSPCMPRVISQTALDLEDAVGSSLASAIDSLDLNLDHQVQQRTRHSLPVRENDGFLPHFTEPTNLSDSRRTFEHRRAYSTMGDRSYDLPYGMPHSAPPHPSFDQFNERVYPLRKTLSVQAPPGSRDVANEDVWSAVLNSPIGPELGPFLTECESHALVLWNVANVSPLDLRTACEAHGEIYYLRDDYCSAFGIVFLAYMDLRASVRAHAGLAHELRNLGAFSSAVHFSIALHAASATEQAAISLRNLPGSIMDLDVARLCQAVGGDVRCVCTKNSNDGGKEVVVEFFDIGAMQLALKHFKAFPPSTWGRHFGVEAAPRGESERCLGRQLLAVFERWHSVSTKRPYTVQPARANSFGGGSPNGSESNNPTLQGSLYRYKRVQSDVSALTTPETTPGSTPPSILELCSHDESVSGNFDSQIQLPVSYHQLKSNALHLRRHSVDQVENIDWYSAGFGTQFKSSYEFDQALPYRGHPGCTMNSIMFRGPEIGKDKGDRLNIGGPMGGLGEIEFSLDLNKIARGADKRTTIMIRNIPNKYTQAMLLQEIDANYFEAYDFFYLPIDFKNRCNVGYAFINFIDYRRIIHFTREFHGQRWRNFNSEKVCAISYARIQGKASMINRFQNSSLMEKDNEYRPLIFHSGGAEKGRPEQFPLGRKPKKTNGTGQIGGVSDLY